MRVLLAFLILTALPAAAYPGESEKKESDDPAEVTEFYDAGYQKLKAEDFRGAIADFQAVLRRDPKHAMAYTNMAYSNRQLGKYRKAIRQYKKALSIDPELAEAHEYMGRALLEVGKLEEAKEHLEILAQLDEKLAKPLAAAIERAERALLASD